MPQKRIIIISDHGNSGGTLTFFNRIYSIFEKDNSKIHLYGFNGPSLNAKELPSTKIDRQLKSKKINIPRSIFFWIEVVDFLLLKFKYRPDALIITTGDPYKWLGSFLIFRKVFFFLHTVPSPFTNPFWKLDLFLLRVRLSLKDRIILTVSEFSRQSILKSFLLKGKEDHVNVLYNYASIPKREEITDTSKIIVLTVGHVVDYKNPNFWFRIAINLLEKYKDKIEFWWVGDGPLLEEYQDKSKDIKGIHFWGYTSTPDSYYAKASIYFQPSIKESQSIATIDGMLYALPCVVSDSEGLPECIENNVSGFIYPSGNENIALNYFYKLIEDPTLRKEMGVQAKIMQGRLFTKDLCEKKIQELVLSSIYGR